MATRCSNIKGSGAGGGGRIDISPLFYMIVDIKAVQVRRPYQLANEKVLVCQTGINICRNLV